MIGTTGTRGLRSALMNAASAASIAAAAVIGAGSANAIVINDNFTATDAIDNAGGINGIGQMVIDNQDGFIGLCTMSLINPRTVIFAAHCVNSRAATAYGNSGTFDIGVFFNVNNNASGNSAIGRWLNPATGNFQTDASRFTYTLNQVQYNIASLEPAAASFLYADVAIGTLDTPAVGIPTWALMFSPLPVPGTITNANGTGYHVNITGYGSRGTATSGSIGIDYRRRAAENMLGGLASLDTFENFLFGGAAADNPQNLYWIDFDSPETPSTTDTARTSPNDFNAWKDDFRTREGITAGGDSGGPLILDAANNTLSTRDLILGVLSGGYTRFYTGAPANGYGTAAFYQPLYLYWDYIAAANSYRYASALAGNGNWEDAAHWQSTLDPNYVVISGSTTVNGIPTSPGAGKIGDAPDFGQVCFEDATTSDCLDTATNVETVQPTPVAGGEYVSDVGRVSIAEFVPELSGAGAAQVSNGAATAIVSGLIDAVSPDPQVIAGFIDPVTPTPMAAYLPGPNPAATLANGLPGATNFVPNNITPSLGVLARYFDITLSASGVTTLSSVVTIDRLRVASAAGLTIGAAGNLSSLIDVTQTGGTVLVNGRLRSVGDYSLMSGLLGGNGTVETPFLTSLMGGIAPGATGQGTVGTLTIQGSAILASGSAFLVDVASAASADRLNVTGALNLGGIFSASAIGGFMPSFGQSWTVANATGGITGGFSGVASNFAGVLRPQLTTTGNNLVLSIIALPFANAAVYDSPEQTENATTLDQIRTMTGGYTGLASLFDSLDQTPVSGLPFIMEALTPLNNFVAGGMAEGNATVVASALVDRSDQLIGGGGHGFDGAAATAMLNSSALQASSDPFDAMMMGAVAVVAAQDEAAAAATSVQLREGWGGFIDVTTLIDSTYEATTFAGDADFNGTGGSVGLDYGFSDGSFAGAALSYVSSDADVFGALQSTESDSFGISAYGGVHEGSSFLTGYVGYAFQSYDLSRTVPLMLGTQTLVASPDGTIFSAGAKMGFDLDVGGGVITPYGSLDGKWINIDGYTETGGSAAMTVADTDTALVDGRLGVTYTGVFALEGGVIRPKLGVAYVIDVQSDDNVVSAAFAGFPGVPLSYLGSDRDDGWVEFEAGLEYEGSNFGLSVNYTGGDNGVLKYNTLSGRVSFSW